MFSTLTACTIPTVLLAASLATLASSPAEAQANDWVFDKPYTTSGAWRIIGGTELGDTCVAETDNDQVTLRIMYTEYTGDWYVGVPYYEQGSPMASVGPGDFTNDAIQMETWVVSGWAMYWFHDGHGMKKNLREGKKFSLILDRGLQVWDLAGSAKAMDLVVQCAQNKPVAAATQSAPAAPAPAAPAPAAPAPAAPAAVPATPAPAPAVPAPAVPSTAGSGNGCPAPGSVKSGGSDNTQVSVQFVDPAPGGKPKTVYWADFDGKLVEMGSIANGTMTLSSYAGHKFLVKAVEGSCVGGPYEVKPGGGVFQVR